MVATDIAFHDFELTFLLQKIQKMSNEVVASSLPLQPSLPTIHFGLTTFNKFTFFNKKKHRWHYNAPKCFLQPSMTLINQQCYNFNFPWFFFKMSDFPDSKYNSSTFPWPWRILFFPHHFLACNNPDWNLCSRQNGQGCFSPLLEVYSVTPWTGHLEENQPINM